MKFKIGDRIRILDTDYIGTVYYIQEGAEYQPKYPYLLRIEKMGQCEPIKIDSLFPAREGELELIKEVKENERINNPGKENTEGNSLFADDRICTRGNASGG
jgi:hypothetical protein